MKYAITNGIILNGTKDMEPLYGRTVLVNDGRIEKIAENGSFSGGGYREIDLEGAYLLPGLINLHVHLAGSGKPKNNSVDAKKLVRLVTSSALTNAVGHRLAAGFAKTQLMSGTTTIRTVGGIADYDTLIRDRINSGKLTGPRILASGMAVSVPGGHMAGSLAYEAETPGQAAAFVDRIAEDKPDLIKLMVTGGVSDAVKRGEPGILKMKPEIIKAACDRAHALGYKVAAHVQSTAGVKAAVQNGVDSIEHGAPIDSETVRLMKDRGAFQVMTISPALPFALFNRDELKITDVMQENGKIVVDGMIEMAKQCLENGIPVGLGTDTSCPYVTQYDMWRELNYYVKYCGVTPSFALYTATLLNATLAGIGDITGSIEAGKSADMIVVKNNPLENIAALSDVSKVIFKGEIYTPRLKKIKVVEQKLNEYV